MAGSTAYVVMLVAGVVIVAVDGQLLRRYSPAYLESATRDPRRARRQATMVAILFHLAMFGVVALVASIGFAENPPVTSVVARVGVLFLLTAAGHAVVLYALGRLRNARGAAELADAGMAPGRSRRPRPSRPVRPALRAEAGDTPADAPET